MSVTGGRLLSYDRNNNRPTADAYVSLRPIVMDAQSLRAEAAIPTIFRCTEMGAHGLIGPVTSGQAEAASLTASYYGSLLPQNKSTPSNSIVEILRGYSQMPRFPNMLHVFVWLSRCAHCRPSGDVSHRFISHLEWWCAEARTDIYFDSFLFARQCLLIEEMNTYSASQLNSIYFFDLFSSCFAGFVTDPIWPVHADDFHHRHSR
jgi:hypothetical protein